MRAISKTVLALLVYLFAYATMLSVGGAPAFSIKAFLPAASPVRKSFYAQEQEPKAKNGQKGEPALDEQEEAADEELAPAAVEMDVSKDSPLIRQLYQATRETKEKEILASLDGAKKLLADGADVKAADAQGRTALH